MNIIKRGNPPSKKIYTPICDTCETQVELTRDEAKFTADRRDGDFLSVECPVCKDTIVFLV